MKKKLTEMAVSKITPEAGRRLEVFDTLAPGFALRVTERGKKRWSVMYRVAGRGSGGNRGPLRRMTLGAYPLIDLKAARERARAAIDLADRGDDPADKRKDEMCQKGERVFEVICARFIELHAKAHTVKWRDTDPRLVLRGLVVRDVEGSSAVSSACTTAIAVSMSSSASSNCSGSVFSDRAPNRARLKSATSFSN